MFISVWCPQIWPFEKSVLHLYTVSSALQHLHSGPKRCTMTSHSLKHTYTLMGGGYFNMRTGGGGIWTANPSIINSQPAIPTEPQLPNLVLLSCPNHKQTCWHGSVSAAGEWNAAAGPTWCACSETAYWWVHVWPEIFSSSAAFERQSCRQWHNMLRGLVTPRGENVTASVPLEALSVQISLKLSLPPSPANSLQNTVGLVRQCQVRVALTANQAPEAQPLRGHDNKLSAVSIEVHVRNVTEKNNEFKPVEQCIKNLQSNWRKIQVQQILQW